MTNTTMTTLPLELESAVGYRFHPTDEELVNYYLKLKMLGYNHEVHEIPEVNVCDYEPWDLPGVECSEATSNDLVWYFFCPPNYKYLKSKRTKRTTKAGYWKSTGRDRIIRSACGKEDIGAKKTLVFYEGRFPNGVRTPWIMHEYKATFNFPNQRDFVLCKLKKKAVDTATFEEGELSPLMGSHHPQSPNGNIDLPVFEQGELTPLLASPFSSSVLEEEPQLPTHLSFRGCQVVDYNHNSALHQSQMYAEQGCSYNGFGTSVPVLQRNVFDRFVPLSHQIPILVLCGIH